MKVLFCTDGSNISYNSIKNFSNWIKNMTVDIFCAADWNFLPDGIAVEDSDFTLRCTNSADAILDYSEELLIQFGINVGKKIKLCGAAVDSITEASRSDRYDVIVMGSNGKKGIQKWLGSVSQEIASSSKTSVYISKGDNPAKRILFAVDGSKTAMSECEKYLDKFNFSDKKVYIATVYESPDYLFLEGNIDTHWIEDVNKKQEVSSGLLLNKYKEMFELHNIKVYKAAILNGNPSSEIIRYASGEKIDTVVCVVRNRNAFSKILLTSVSRRILENSKSDVFLIKSNSLAQ